MIVADTNVISELMSDRPVVFGGRPWIWNSDDVWAVTAITRLEVMNGVMRLPAGRRRRALLAGANQVLDGRICLPFDAEAADACANLIAMRRSLGRPLPAHDGMIASICLTRGLPLATRNVRDFTGLGIELIDPWDPADR